MSILVQRIRPMSIRSEASSFNVESWNVVTSHHIWKPPTSPAQRPEAPGTRMMVLRGWRMIFIIPAKYRGGKETDASISVARSQSRTTDDHRRRTHRGRPSSQIAWIRRDYRATGSSSSITVTDRTWSASSAALAVWPRPKPPTSKSRQWPVTCDSAMSARAISASLTMLDIRNAPASLTSKTSTPPSDRTQRRRRISSPNGVIAWSSSSIDFAKTCHPGNARRPQVSPQPALPDCKETSRR